MLKGEKEVLIKNITGVIEKYTSSFLCCCKDKEQKEKEKTTIINHNEDYSDNNY